MAQDTQAADRVRTAYDPPAAPDTGRGWAVFCGSLFIMVALANTIYGIAALAKDDYFRVDELLFWDISAWGVFALIFAAFQAFTGIMILRQRGVGALLGIVLAVFHATVTLMSIGAYPLWSTLLLALDGLIVYGLTVHSDEWA